MSNVFSGRTTISSIHENPTVDTKIMNMLMFCWKSYKFNFSLGTNGDQLGFYPEYNGQKYFLPTPLYFRHSRKPLGRHPNHESLYSVIIISAHCWLCTNGGHFISAYLQVSVSILTFFTASRQLAAILKNAIMLRQVCKTIIFFWNIKSAYYYL